MINYVNTSACYVLQSYTKTAMSHGCINIVCQETLADKSSWCQITAGPHHASYPNESMDMVSVAAVPDHQHLVPQFNLRLC